jgi:hypothetical protein
LPPGGIIKGSAAAPAGGRAGLRRQKEAVELGRGFLGRRFNRKYSYGFGALRFVSSSAVIANRQQTQLARQP